jgi:hypothetical protein
MSSIDVDVGWRQLGVMLSTCGDDSASGLTEAVSTASALRQVRTQGCGTSLYTLGGQSQCSYITAWELYPDSAIPISTTLQIYVSEALHSNFFMEHETKNAGKAHVDCCASLSDAGNGLSS